MMVGKVEQVPLPDIWKHEAYDFTSWLQDDWQSARGMSNDSVRGEMANWESNGDWWQR